MRPNVDFEAIANRMHYRARSGEYCGDDSTYERRYIKKCSTRVATTTLILTRDVGTHRFGWLSESAHDRCLHLSIAGANEPERDAWLRACFGAHVEHLWGMSSVTIYAEHRGVVHWRLFCDESWRPLGDIDPRSLLAAGMRPARDLGILSRALAA